MRVRIPHCLGGIVIECGLIIKTARVRICFCQFKEEKERERGRLRLVFKLN